MRLIDADALKEKSWSVKLHLCGACVEVVSVSDIDNAPTIEAVAVVRCKDCKFMYYNFKLHCKCCANNCDGETPTIDSFYCADGERREDATDNSK